MTRWRSGRTVHSASRGFPEPGNRCRTVASLELPDHGGPHKFTLATE